MISVDFTLFLQVVNFVIILVIGKKMILDPVSGTVDKRNQKIDALLSEAEELKETVARSKSDYEEKLQNVKTEVAEHHRTVRDAVLKETNEKVSAAKASLDAKVKSAREELEQEFAKAQETLKADADSFATSIVEKITGKAA